MTALTEESSRKTRELEEGARVAEEQQGKLRWEETERRRLHNIIQELKGNIRVFCRSVRKYFSNFRNLQIFKYFQKQI